MFANPDHVKTDLVCKFNCLQQLVDARSRGNRFASDRVGCQFDKGIDAQLKGLCCHKRSCSVLMDFLRNSAIQIWYELICHENASRDQKWFMYELYVPAPLRSSNAGCVLGKKMLLPGQYGRGRLI